MPRVMQRKKPPAEAGFAGRVKYLLLGTLFGLVSAVFFSLIFSFLMPMSFVPEEMLSVLVCFVAFLGAFLAGFSALRLIGSAGLLNGLICGALFLSGHLIAAMLAGGIFYGAVIFIFLSLELSGGILGGIVSVNTK